MGQHLTTVDSALASVPGVVSVWCGRPGQPAAYQRRADAVHPAASTLKVAVLAALYRAVDAGALDLNQTVMVSNEFRSQVSSAGRELRYGCNRRHDSDESVWERLGASASLGWLAQRMIVTSSNLAANLVLTEVGLAAVADALHAAGTRQMVVGRGIEDAPASAAGIANLTTAADLATLFSALAQDTIASAPACAAMLDLLAAQEVRGDLAAGLPPGTRVALKNGWLNGIRHSAGVVFPADAPPFVLSVCLSTPWAVNRHDDEACQLVAKIAAAAWADRHEL
jgi:beta-lactamase class A